MQDGKVQENRVRRMADRQGYRLMRSRARDPRDLTYGGYQLINLESGGCDFGWGNAGRGYAASLEDIEAYLTDDGRTATKRGPEAVARVKQHKRRMVL